MPPPSLAEAAAAFHATMGGYPAYWGIAGGWAIDLFLDHQTRPHEDLEVVALRRDHAALFAQLRDRRPRLIHPGETVRFEDWHGEPFPDNVIQLRLAPRSDAPDFDVLLTPAAGGDWICRRDEQVLLPLPATLRATALGLPVLAPEIVLLFKAKRVEEKDESDFRHALPALGKPARAWLQLQLARLYPGHAWLPALPPPGI